jgi:hypothetical protein
LHIEPFDNEPPALFGELNRDAVAGLHQTQLDAFSVQPDRAIGRYIEPRCAAAKMDADFATYQIDLLDDAQDGLSW